MSAFSPRYELQGPGAGPSPTIKCSDCGVWLELLSMGEHVCVSPADSNWRRPDMSVQIPRASLYPATLAAHGTDSGKDFLGPPSPAHSSRSGPPSPGYLEGPVLSRSVSSSSSTNSNGSRPFFERYQKLVGSVASGVGASMSRSASLFEGTSRSRPADTPSPTFTSFVSPLIDSPPMSRLPITSSSMNVRLDDEFAYSSKSHTSPGSPHSHDSRSTGSSLQPTQTTSSSLYSNSPRSRKLSLADDVPVRLTASQSTPSHLASYVEASAARTNLCLPEPVTPKSRARNASGKSRKNLDACLEDLRLMTDEEEGEDDILDDFYGSSYDEDDSVRTPRAPTAGGSGERRLPHSRSSPAIASPTMVPKPVAPPPRPSHRKCTTCRVEFPELQTQRSGDGQRRLCYADRFLPKCRKCREPIEGGAVTSSDGKVVGKYHPHCFSCFQCSAPFPNREFYVHDGRPCCKQHYHELNGSICTNLSCLEPIEGECVSLVGEESGDGGRYHPSCFQCAHKTCSIPLLDHHFVLDHLPYCERHANVAPAKPSRSHAFLDQPSRGMRDGRRCEPVAQAPTSRARKRQTFITRA